MKNVYAVWEGERTRSYITPWKKYEVLPRDSVGFYIVDDEGDILLCTWDGCAHLNFGNWTRIEEDEEAPQPEQKTLRDEFAMNWLLGYISNPETASLSYELTAEIAYEVADAMLEARKK